MSRMKTNLEKDFLTKRRVRIPFEHLSPALKEAIGYSGKPSFAEMSFPMPVRYKQLRKLRSLRGLFEIISVASAMLAADEFSKGRYSRAVLDSSATGASAIPRTVFAKMVQEKHDEIVRAMEDYGLLTTSAEKSYPGGWLNPATVLRTHPIFFVAANGDLVLLRESRVEYARYKFQKALPGRWGLNLWRWRAYLRPPEAPESVKSLAARKWREWLPKPALQPTGASLSIRRAVKRA